MPYKARVHAVVKYFAHERKMLLNKPLARRVHLTCPMYMKVVSIYLWLPGSKHLTLIPMLDVFVILQAVPSWCNNKITCYQQIISRWIDPEWWAEHRMAKDRHALMGGMVHLQGNLNLHAYVQKKVIISSGSELLNLCPYGYYCFYCRIGREVRAKRSSIPSRDYVSPASQRNRKGVGQPRRWLED